MSLAYSQQHFNTQNECTKTSFTSTTDGSGFYPLGFITELSEHIGKDWMKLARELGLSKTNIDAIQIDNYPYGLEEQIFQFFQKWKQCKGMNATVEMLINGLKAAELNDQLELMKKAGFLPEGK